MINTLLDKFLFPPPHYKALVSQPRVHLNQFYSRHSGCYCGGVGEDLQNESNLEFMWFRYVTGYFRNVSYDVTHLHLLNGKFIEIVY